MPCSKWERQEDETAGNHFNCPIVASYPEALRLNIDELRDDRCVRFVSPWVPYHDKEQAGRAPGGGADRDTLRKRRTGAAAALDG